MAGSQQTEIVARFHFALFRFVVPVPVPVLRVSSAKGLATRMTQKQKVKEVWTCRARPGALLDILWIIGALWRKVERVREVSPRSRYRKCVIRKGDASRHRSIHLPCLDTPLPSGCGEPCISERTLKLRLKEIKNGSKQWLNLKCGIR